MARIQSGIGLSTGIQIQETVDALMKVAARPRDNLFERTGTLEKKQVAVTELAGLLYALKTSVTRLGRTSVFGKRTATSSNTSALSVSATTEAPEGTYQITPFRTAQSQQLLSAGFAASDRPIGAGTLRFRFGAHVEDGLSLDLLQGGHGITRGKIRITDRSGAQAEIDLSTALTIDDVLEAINGNAGIDVTATARGDRLRLRDNTGQTASNLKVAEVGGGTTAASLGLAGIDVAAEQADGDDLLWLFEDLDLSQLNDAAGVRIDTVLDDIEYTLRDGTTGTIDLSPIISGSSEVDHDLTLGDLLDRINAAAPEKLQAAIAPDGDRLVITDLTSGAGDFTLSSSGAYDVLADLGLDGTAVDGQITGRRILGGLRSVLLSSLGGGGGLGELGSVQLTDRSGATATVDLSSADTLQDVVEAINAAGIGVRAGVNPARTGIRLVDTTGSTAGNLVVANADGTNTADKLGIALDEAVDEIDGGDLHLQVVALSTRLDDLNGGRGVARGSFTIRDSSQHETTINRTASIETVGELVREINLRADNVRAEINETGDGIRLVDTAGGDGELTIIEGSTTVAADLHLLHLLGGAKQVEVDGQPAQVIDGSTTYTVELDDQATLEGLRAAIAELDAGVTASILTAGTTRPYHLALASEQAGRQGRLVIDASQFGVDFSEMSRAQDALLIFGDPGSPGSNLLLTSSTNTFEGAVPGLTLTVGQPTETPVTVTVSQSDSDLVGAVRTMVNDYNRFRERLAKLTAFDTTTETASVLTGDSAALRLDTDVPYLLSGSFQGAGPIRALAELGIDFKDDGTLTLDETQLKKRFAADPRAVEQFFTTEGQGFSDRFDRLIEQLAGEQDTSLLTARIGALGDTIQRNYDRISQMEAQLDLQRERMLMDFYRMELAVGKMQTMMTALASIQALQPLTVSTGSRNWN